MSHKLFISCSHKDKPIADGICANLETAGLRCWIAPRDIYPGKDWPTAIANGIAAADFQREHSSPGHGNCGDIESSGAVRLNFLHLRNKKDIR